MISKNKLAQIHVAKAQLGLSDDEYRAILARTAGVSSAKELTDRNVGAVIHEFRRLGFQPKAPKRAGRVPNNLYRDEMVAKIEAQLSELGASWGYAEAIARRQTGIARIEWLKTEKQYRGVIAALDVELEKRDRLAAIDRHLEKTDQTRESFAGRCRLPQGWERHLPTLRAICEGLERLR